MKFLIVCGIFLGVFGVQGAPLNNDQRQKLRSYCKECIEKTGVNDDLVDKTRKGFFSDDPLLKEFFFCFAQKVGFQNEDGSVNRDVISQKLNKVMDDPDMVSQLVEQCVKEYDSPQQTAINIAQCLYNNSPSHVQIFKVSPDAVFVGNKKSDKLTNYHKACVEETSANEAAVNQAWKDGEFLRDPNLKKYLLCFAMKTGFQNELGDINAELFRHDLLEIINDPALVDRIVQKCVQKRDTPEETAYHAFKCTYDNSPVHVTLYTEHVEMPEDVSTELTKVFRQCIKQSGVDRDVLVMSQKGEFADDKRLKEYYFCVAKLWGVMNEAGDILPDVLTKKTQEIYRDEALTKKLAGLCGVRKDQPLETAFQMAQCYYKNAPGDLKIMQSGVLSDEQKATIRANIRECSEETNAIKDVVQQARQGNFADNQSLKEYLLCIAKKNQAQDANGKLNVATIREKLGTVLGAKDADEIAEKCAKERATPSDTAFEAFKCFYDNAPEVAPVF